MAKRIVPTMRQLENAGNEADWILDSVEVELMEVIINNIGGDLTNTRAALRRLRVRRKEYDASIGRPG